MKRTRAFTLIELLVVVAIIALLISILLPSLAKAKEMARRSVCATQLKSQGTSFAIYATAWNNQLPNGPGFIGGAWFHDEPITFGDTLLGIATNSGMSPTSVRRWFYCPSNLEYNSDLYWNPAGNSNYRRMGYAYLNDRGPGLPPLTSTTVLSNSPGASRPDFEYRTQWLPPYDAQKEELVADIILSTIQPNPATNWAPYQNPSTGAWTTSVSHMNGNKPAGANVLCLDGHVEWRPYADTHTISIQCSGPSGNPFFTFINPY